MTSHKKLRLYRGLALDERGWDRSAKGPQGWRWYQAERIDKPVSMLVIRCDNRDAGKKGAPKMEIHIPDEAAAMSPLLAAEAITNLAILFGVPREAMAANVDESAPPREIVREKTCAVCGFVERVAGIDEIPSYRRITACASKVGSYCTVECRAEVERRMPILRTAIQVAPQVAPPRPGAESRAARERRLLEEYNRTWTAQ